MMKFSILLNAKESVLLLDYMKENKVKTKADAIKKISKNCCKCRSKICYIERYRWQIKYNNVYMEIESSRINGKDDNITTNLSSKEFQSLILKQLKSNEPVYFYCFTTSKRINGVWIDIMERIDNKITKWKIENSWQAKMEIKDIILQQMTR